MNNARIDIGGAEYGLALTVRATKDIAEKFGSLEEFGETLQQQSPADAIDSTVWLICLLANQWVNIHNRRNPSDLREPLTQDDVEMFVDVLELTQLRHAIEGAFASGTKRQVQADFAQPGKSKKAT